jgi:hypothetical protein
MTSLERGLESQIDKNVFIFFGESLTDYEQVIEGYEYHLPLLDSKKCPLGSEQLNQRFFKGIHPCL